MNLETIRRPPICDGIVCSAGGLPDCVAVCPECVASRAIVRFLPHFAPFTTCFKEQLAVAQSKRG